MLTRRGEEVAVVVSVATYRELSRAKEDFKEFLLSGPDLSELEMERSREPARDIDLQSWIPTYCPKYVNPAGRRLKRGLLPLEAKISF